MSKLNSFKVKIPLTESHAVSVSLWLERFHAKAVHIWAIPELNGQLLTIHPADFANLLSYADPNDCTELEFYRIRKLGENVILQSISKTDKLSIQLKEMVALGLKGLAPSLNVEDESQYSQFTLDQIKPIEI